MRLRAPLRAFSRSRRTELATLTGYGLVACVYLAPPLVVGSGSRYVGQGRDAELFVWAFAWWPHAILHWQNPFFSHMVWAPSGVNLTWTTSVPGLALLFAPLTLIVGPIVSYNVAAIVVLALCAWTGFLLCRHLTRSLWPSLAGGYLFGFSTYEVGHAGSGHLNLTSSFLLPLVVLVLVRFVEGELGGRGLALRLGPLLAFELLISTEMTLTLTLALAVALVLGLVLLPARRKRLLALIPPVTASYAVAGLVTAPFVYYLLTGFVSHGFTGADEHTADLVNFVVPPSYVLVGGQAASVLAGSFPDIYVGQEAYIGLPALLVVALYARRGLRDAVGRFLLAFVAVAVLATLGAAASAAGHRVLDLPWALVHTWPLLENVQTVRLAAYVALGVAVAVALWAAGRRHGALRWLLPVLAVVAIVPGPSTDRWTTRYRMPPFFTDASYRACLDPGENILPLPIGQGEAMLWQAAAGFRFSMAGGYLGPVIPPSFLATQGSYGIAGGLHLGPEQTPAVRAFIAKNHVTSAVVDQGEESFFAGALDPIATPQWVGGVVLYHFTATPPSCA